jgi:hypothetical protein
MPVDGSGMREIVLLALIVPDLFLHDERHTSLHQP